MEFICILFVYFLLNKCIEKNPEKSKPSLNKSALKKNESKAFKVAPTSGQHHSLIKQGITGLHRDSHYRPLEESSGGCLFVSQSSRCTVLNGLHVAVGHEAALIKSIPLPFLFTKIPFPPSATSSEKGKNILIYKQLCTCSKYPFVDFREDCDKAVWL